MSDETMTREKAIDMLKPLQDELGDWEIAHADADDIICDLLCDLGYDDVVDEYAKVPKWYA